MKLPAGGICVWIGNFFKGKLRGKLKWIENEGKLKNKIELRSIQCPLVCACLESKAQPSHIYTRGACNDNRGTAVDVE